MGLLVRLGFCKRGVVDLGRGLLGSFCLFV